MFLATTAISDFWERNDELLFLGSWCLRYDRRREWETLTYQVLPSPWDDRAKFYQATAYLDALAERMLEALTDYLNAVHHVSYTRRYWRILVGPWLLHYLHASYDRYIHLTEALARYPTLNTLLMAPESFRVPVDTKEIVDGVEHDPYNLQLCSELLTAMGHRFPARPHVYRRTESGDVTRRKRWRGRAAHILRKAARLAAETTGRGMGQRVAVGLCNLLLSGADKRALMHATNFQAVPLEMTRNEWPFAMPQPVFDDRRLGLRKLPGGAPFEEIFVQSLSQHFPVLFLEGFHQARECSLREAEGFLPVVGSAVDWYWNEPFKFYAAEAADKGSRLLAVQHGGGYGIFRYSAMELHESRISDAYFVWGWEGAKGVIKNLPSPTLSAVASSARRPADAQARRQILFIGTAHTRYLFRFHSTPVGSQWEDYFAWELRFLAAVPDRLRPFCALRPYPYDFGFAVQERIAERFPEVGWDRSPSVTDGFRQSRVVVIDHCSTTTLQALRADVPTILFWDPERWEVRDSAAPDLEALRASGIFWDSPELAAAKAAEVYDDPEAWWSRPAVQEARRRFVERYALASPDWPRQWARALKEEARLAGAGA